MEPAVAYFLEAGLRDRALMALTVSILLLVVVSLVFAASTLVFRVVTLRRERRWAELSARWQGPVLGALVDSGAAHDVHAVIAPRDRLLFVRFAVEYARRVKGDELLTLKALAMPYLPQVELLTASPRAEVRARAVQALGALGLPRHAEAVIAGLDDESPLVAMVAARALCTPDHPDYIALVLRRIPRFRDWRQGFLASMLASVGPEAAPALREVLGDIGATGAARAVAADALRFLKDLQAGDLAARVAEQSPDPELLSAALRLLGVAGRPEHADVVRARTSSAAPGVRVAAVRALATLGTGQDRDLLRDAVGDPSPWVAMQAARGLLAIGAGDVLQDLRDSDHPQAPLAAQVLLEAGSDGS